MKRKNTAPGLTFPAGAVYYRQGGAVQAVGPGYRL